MTDQATFTERYEAKAKTMSRSELRYAINDIQLTLDIWRDESTDHPYVAKLLAEFDAYTVEHQRRMKELLA